jgi:hypothetical protein
MTWALVLLRLKRGGAPATLVRETCTKILELANPPERFLENTVRVWQERRLPEELAGPLLADVKQSLEQLTFLRKQVAIALEQVSGEPRISVEQDTVNQAVQRANQGNRWVRLRDALA